MLKQKDAEIATRKEAEEVKEANGKAERKAGRAVKAPTKGLTRALPKVLTAKDSMARVLTVVEKDMARLSKT